MQFSPPPSISLSPSLSRHSLSSPVPWQSSLHTCRDSASFSPHSNCLPPSSGSTVKQTSPTPRIRKKERERTGKGNERRHSPAILWAAVWNLNFLMRLGLSNLATKHNWAILMCKEVNKSRQCVHSLRRPASMLAALRRFAANAHKMRPT